MASVDDRHRPFSAVYLLLFDGDDVLLLERRNTGHRDGEYSLVAGHIDPGETAAAAMVREADEEVGIDVEPDALEHVHTLHRRSADRVYLDLYFVAEDWTGELRNREPEKCAELRWAPRADLPPNTVPYVEQGIRHVDGAGYSEFGW